MPSIGRQFQPFISFWNNIYLILYLNFTFNSFVDAVESRFRKPCFIFSVNYQVRIKNLSYGYLNIKSAAKRAYQRGNIPFCDKVLNHCVHYFFIVEITWKSHQFIVLFFWLWSVLIFFVIDKMTFELFAKNYFYVVFFTSLTNLPKILFQIPYLSQYFY